MRFLEQGDWRRAYALADQLVDRLVDRQCAVDPETLKNPVPWFRALSWYQWQVIDERLPGEILAYRLILRALDRHPEFEPFRPSFSAIRAKLEMEDPTAEQDVIRLNAELDRRLAGLWPQPQAQCDKRTLFLERVSSLAASHSAKLLLVALPAEWQLRNRTATLSASQALCDPASKLGLECADFAARMFSYFENAKQPLYLDGAHFNAEGNKLVAGWIHDELRRRPLMWSRLQARR